MLRMSTMSFTGMYFEPEEIGLMQSYRRTVIPQLTVCWLILFTDWSLIGIG